MSQKLIFKERN